MDVNGDFKDPLNPGTYETQFGGSGKPIVKNQAALDNIIIPPAETQKNREVKM